MDINGVTATALAADYLLERLRPWQRLGDRSNPLHSVPPRPPEHLRQIPADEILAHNEPEVALTILLEHCERSTKRWEALAAAMTFDYNDEKITFGQLLDSLDLSLAEAQMS
ncbi:hypothetical protein [Streptomyces acidiscabies]|uniref:Uncharacterized protein n=1 Tax=Streptomyces acidiscabies TaxID=42234 RepID=A0AAP6EK99_9ACTN|nr:hypothetical protein [Streptomyces acidiscabies]MDX2965839.1 hypothetical protein [Streptomyces acidiscabies]MDX3025333.1 hypothetical protein [Streptomyces acidiscabies]MDX3795675.1 hypothetical protein [Streptomyces acidiscabies]GAQ58793.1 hypothetical protein a10_08689 [Streptomyces acidiscabies]GAV45766.1 hypothetical protein Saa2_08758 [Streptomyces acidiscabies]